MGLMRDVISKHFEGLGYETVNGGQRENICGLSHPERIGTVVFQVEDDHVEVVTAPGKNLRLTESHFSLSDPDLMEKLTIVVEDTIV